VSNVTNRAEVLSLLFQLLSFVLYTWCVGLHTAHPRRQAAGTLLALAFAALAALSKESGLMVVPISIAYDLLANGFLQARPVSALVLAVTSRLFGAAAGAVASTTAKRKGPVVVHSVMAWTSALAQRLLLALGFVGLFMAVRLKIQVR
jgi:hypothetical protein